MSEYKIECRKLLPVEYQTMRNSTGWGRIDDDAVCRALENDLFSVCIYDNDKIIGIGRVIGDGAIYFYIQDLIVLPEYHGKGIGNLLMEKIESFLKAKSNNNSFIGLMAAEGVNGFYHKYGYSERPDSRPGMFKVMKKNHPES